MRREVSYGIIPLQGKKVLLVRHKGGHWAFPKGHPDAGETPEMTAWRELKEETNLDIVTLLPHTPLEEHYFFTFEGEKIEKRVFYFLAEVKGRVEIQKKEVIDYKWVFVEEAEDTATFPATKKLCKTIHHLLQKE